MFRLFLSPATGYSPPSSALTLARYSTVPSSRKSDQRFSLLEFAYTKNVYRVDASVNDLLNLAHIASQVRSRISLPSRNMASQIRQTADFGKQVAYMVNSHCIVKTFVNAGSYSLSEAIV